MNAITKERSRVSRGANKAVAVLLVIYCMQYSNRRTFCYDRRMEPWQAEMWLKEKKEAGRTH